MGKPGQTLHRRINGHCYDIVLGRTEDSPVLVHFKSDAHSQANTTVMAIDEVQSCDLCLQKIWDRRWIRILGTSFPYGMNFRVNSL